jgi:ArsR family transcriptional regulator
MHIRNDTSTPAEAPDLKPLFRMHAELCRALANEHRQAILHAICNDERCVGDIAAEIGISVHNVSQHLRILKERRLVASRKEGQTVYYRVTNQKFMEACALIRQALVEQHQAQGESLQAVEFLDAAQHAAAQTPGMAAASAGPAPQTQDASAPAPA